MESEDGQRMRHLKKIIGCVLTTAMVMALNGCSQNGQQKTDTQPAQTQAAEKGQAESSQMESSQEESKETQTQGTPESGQGENGSGAGQAQTADGSTLVIYFSATGNTENVAGYIAKTLGADTYEITAAEAYTSDDLDWTDDSSRVSQEHKDPDLRPAIGGDLVDISGYDTIFLGYPLWWGEAPNIVRTLMESVDFTGKTMVPFCTSSSSPLGTSAETLQAFAPDAEWIDGQRFPSHVSEEEVVSWVESLGLAGK